MVALSLQLEDSQFDLPHAQTRPANQPTIIQGFVHRSGVQGDKKSQ